MLAALVAVVLSPPLAQAVADLQREVDRASRVVATIHAQTTGARPQTLRVDEDVDGTAGGAPWALQATLGKSSWRGTHANPVGTFPVVDATSPMSFRLLPQMDLREPAVTVRVCRGAACHEPSWGWRCYPAGGCEVEGQAGQLLGDDVGRHLVTFTILAIAAGARQEWEFTAAPTFASVAAQ